MQFRFKKRNRVKDKSGVAAICGFSSGLLQFLRVKNSAEGRAGTCSSGASDLISL